MKFSIIIPIYNEEKNILSILNILDKLKGYYEVIFSDGGSCDKTLDYIGNKYKIIKSEKGRGNQINNGSKVSSGDVLFFLHCDSIIEEDVLLKIEEKINKGYSVGCLKLRFDSKNILMKCCSVMSNARVKYRQIAFGDQGIFITRKAFENIGGMPNLPIMEDYQFSINVNKKYKICQVNSKIITSARRFEAHGIIKTMYKMQCLQRMFRKGYNINTINKMYRNIR